MVYEGRIYYSIMKWKKGAPTLPYTEDELAFGPILLKKKPEIFLEYLKTQLGKINAVLKDPLPKDKRGHYLDLYRRIKAYLN